ncbi:nitroreductase family deazaflavin-dependent oxidoreductase [Streptomyces sp. TS71-3]|uniref:nitroreductase family deazaflavin-dependent oxidoreductase n=1 Tax=Streptomyces sp. TS71-3 TaxID=2733862 RepID=UPI001B11CE07|nr:nitroreductase family deazaflavin-dependent oxidoreductase [Streptomyces sp. TS71-3]GHJ38509.1 hypothetical protein Sm713_41180 [Streptomyces sp. TS71-3]
MAHVHPEGWRPSRPTGWRRRLARLPVHLYRVGLGPLLGKRFLLLHHTGRISGLDRTVVLEVVAFDQNGPASWTLASGFGPKADWYQNLRREPQTTIQVGNRYVAVTAHFLAAEDGGAIMARYAPLHPRVAGRLCAFMGFEVDGSVESFRQAGELIPFVRLVAAPAQ